MEAVHRKREEVLKHMEKQKECEERAVMIVERLLEEDIAEEFLKDSAQLITPSHYRDVTEERSIGGVCGYPLCNNSLGQVPKQKYHISTKHNKVYDITERKKFCCNQCYQASIHFERQISTSPLFLRNKEPDIEFKLLPLKETKGKPGEEVVTNPLVALKDELENLEIRGPDVPLAGSADLDVEGRDDLDVDSQSEEEDVTERHMEELDSDDDDEEEEEVQEQEQEAYRGQMKVRHRGQGGSRSSQGQRPKKVESAEDKMKKLMGMIDRRDKLIEQLKEGRCDRVEENQVGQGDSRSRSGGQMKKHGAKMTNKTRQGMVRATNSPEQTPVGAQTGFANRVLENIKKASVQKVNIERLEDSEVKGQGHGTEKSVTVDGPVSSMSEDSVGQKNSFEVVKNSLLAWKTEQTLEYLMTSDGTDFKNRMCVQEKIDQISQRLDAEEASDELERSNIVRDERPKEKVPDYQELSKQAKDFDVKVREFYQGHMTYPLAEEMGTMERPGTTSEGGVKEHEVQWEPALPLVDSQSQMMIRRKIVMDGINHALPTLLAALKLTPAEVATHIKGLVLTFQLSPHNIVFKPQEWCLLAAVLLKILSHKEKKFTDAFGLDTAATMMKNLGDRFAFSQDDLERLEQSLTTSEVS